jgi:hypothetical protein
MTIDEWCQNSDQFFDYLAHSEIYSLPEWDGWKERINQVLSEMAYEDAMGCEFEDLINLAGLTGEIELAIKEHDMDKRIKDLQSDF